MDCDSTAGSWLDIAHDVPQDTSTRFWQDEPIQPNEAIDDPICFFGKFVAAVSSDSLGDAQPQLKFSAFVRDLCLKAPTVAEYLVREILNHPNGDFPPEAQGSQELETSTTIKRPKGRKQPDRSYRPSKTSRIQPDTHRDGDEVPHDASSVSSQVGDELGTCQSDDDDDIAINQGSESLVTDQTIPKFEGEIPRITTKGIPQGGVEDDSLVHGRTLPPIANESTLLQLQATCTNDGLKRNVVHRQPSVALDEAATDIRTTNRPSSPNAMEPREPALSEIDEKGSDAQASSDTSSPQVVEPHATLLPDPIPSTPVGKLSRRSQSPISDDQTATPQTALFTPTVNGGVLSPLTEDDWTASPPDKVEMTLLEGLPSPSSTGQQQLSLCSTASIEGQQVDREQSLPTQDSPAILPPSSLDQAPTLAEMTANAVHLLYEMGRRREIPKEIHSRILTTIRPSLDGTPATPATVGPPDPALITSSSTTWSASTWINMLEAGHARSKEATILNMIEWMGASEWYDAELQQAEKAPPRTKRGTLRKRLATIVLDKYLKEACSTAATDGTGNLTSDNEDRRSSLDAAGIQTRILNARRKRLNNIFHRGRTLRKLVQMTHLGILFDPDIWSFAKASKEEVDKIAARFQADPRKMEFLSILDEQVRLLAEEGRPDLSRFLNSLESRSIAPSREISRLRAEYGFEKEPVPQSYLDTALDRVIEGVSHVLGKHPLGENDSVIVNGAVELSGGVFDRLRSREWLNCWDIAAALEMTDRPVLVHLGLSIPLHRKDANGEVTLISNPFGRWRKEIDSYMHRDMNDLKRPQVFICPLNINANHFTLLEINEQTKMIYHYNSMRTKSTLVRRVVEAEFKDLGFGYTEAPTPQQKDGWSCGLMVIRNAKQRMNGLSIGAWNSEVDPDRVIKEVIGNCQMFLGSDALQPRPLSKKRKTVEGVQSSVLGPTRFSKRLRNDA
ncbi:hypothetical protein ACEPPN_015183 [Leptodophora sp. 'Broadleaf-Isolate-01']